MYGGVVNIDGLDTKKRLRECERIVTLAYCIGLFYCLRELRAYFGWYGDKSSV